MPPILYLIDGHALAYRSYYALIRTGPSRWQTSKGEPTAGIFGFANTLLSLFEKEQPEYLAIAFDTGKTFRDDIFPEYKATRAKMPEDLRPQIERIRQLVDAFQLPRLEVDGFEADDVLGSIARIAVEQGFGVKIITGDRDLLQLVSDRVIVNLPRRKTPDDPSPTKDYTEDDVIEFLGISPAQVIDYKALAGDSSDNIPGIRGVGDKTATSLLQEYPTLEEIYAHIDDLKPRTQKLLKAGHESALLSQKLAAIRTDAPITLDLQEARTDKIDFASVGEFFRELEFGSLLKRLPRIAGSQTDIAAIPTQQLSLFGKEITQISQPGDFKPTVHIISDQDSLHSLVQTIEKADAIAVDTETTSTDPLDANLVGISLAVKEDEGYYIPTGHNTGEEQLPLQEVLDALRPALTHPGSGKVGHNLKYDLLVLARHGLTPSPLSFDTMIAGWLVNPASHRLGLKDMAESILNIRMTRISELLDEGSGRRRSATQRTMADVPVEEVAPYAVSDAVVTMRLRPILHQQLEKHNALNIFNDMEMPLIPILADMEQAGITLDIAYLKDMSAELSRRMDEITQQVHREAGKEFNLNSTQQLSDVLFKDLDLKPPKRSRRTASGHYSTSAAVLENLRGEHPIVDWIMEYRELAKLKSTYLEALPTRINPSTNRVHTSFNQVGSVTGRLASSKPNLQNIPTRTEIGHRVRRGFVAAPGMALLAVDYSQVELRIVAHMSDDQAMQDAFKQGQDIHATTAAAIYDTSLADVTKEQRRHAKAINFGLIYGMSPFGLSRSTGLTLAEAEKFVDNYFIRFPGVKEYLDNLRDLAARQGYVETLLGRRRYFPNLSSLPTNQRRREEREAINAPIQGTAADIIKLAMLPISTALRDESLEVRLLLQVHDELIFECPPDQLVSAAKLVQNIMENAITLRIPLITEARSGENWGDLSPLQLAD